MPGLIGRQDAKTVAARLPIERLDRLLDLDAFDRTILFFHAKDLQVRVTWSFTDMVPSDYAPGVSLHDVLEHDM